MQSTNNFNNNDKTDDSVKTEQSYANTNNGNGEKKVVNENLCKVFIGNIPRTATEDQINDFFGQKNVQFKEMQLMKDNVNPSMNRGFGFFTLNTEEDTDRLLFAELDTFQGKTLDIKRAAPKDCDDPLIQTKTERAFVGGLPQSYTVEDVTALFNDKYGSVGKVVEVIPKKDKITGKSRGFCFVVFENFHVVDKIMIDNRFPYLNNKRLEVRKASSDVPILGGPPSGDASGMRRPSGGPGGKLTRGSSDHRNSRMNQNPYRNGGNQMPGMRHAPRRPATCMGGYQIQGSQYPRQTFGYTNRPAPPGYAESSAPSGMNNPHIQPTYGSHIPEVPTYGSTGASASYVPYGAAAQPMPSAYSAAGSQYPYGAVNYGVNQGGAYQAAQMPNYPGASNTSNAAGSTANPPSGQTHPGY